jgi:TonB-linked SusC/RagA family outer membrane protein
VGVSEQVTTFSSIYAIRRNFTRNPATGDFYTVLNAGEEPFQSGGSVTKNTNLGYLGRLNYNFADRYLASFTFRYDGDSRFGEANRWGFFPSASAAWRISQEEFFSLPAFSDLRLKASYGALGNTGHGPWAYIPSININPRAVFGAGQLPVAGATQTVIVDPNLKWEEKRVTNVGVEAGLLENRLTFTAEWYRSVSKDVLISVPVPASTGGFNPGAVDDFTTLFTNAASIQNTGLDFSSTFRSPRNPFQWDVTVNLTTINNKVLNLGNQGANNYRSTHLTRTEVGHSIGEWFLLRTNGIFQNQQEIDAHKGQPGAKPGDIRFVDVNKDGMINNNDREYAGSPWPKLQSGLIWNASFKNFTLGMQWYGVTGNKIFNAARWWMERFDDNSNYTTGIKPWTGEGTSNSMPRLVSNPLNANEITDRWLENGSYLRLRNLELGYSIPATFSGRIGLNSTRVYVSGQNLITFTKYSGLDPDIANNNILLRGWDAGIFPQLRVLSGGIQFGF